MIKKIEIPEGHEARIEGNKVILERKESEDERVRKAIKMYVEDMPDTFGFAHGIVKEDMLAYLERQKGQILIPKFKVGDRIYDKRDSYNRNVIREVGKDYYINAFAQKMDMAYTDANFEFLEHLGSDSTPNRPAEWSEDIIQKAIKEVGLTQHQIDWFKTNVFPPKAEWREEDKQFIEHCAKLLDKQGAPLCASRLKSLHPQPKQEWSEKDDEIMKNIILAIREVWQDKDASRMIAKLKSLRPTWKLSEQEKGAIRTAIYVLTEERTFPRTAARLQNILNAFESYSYEIH